MGSCYLRMKIKCLEAELEIFCETIAGRVQKRTRLFLRVKE